jgi:hypothetical protein
MDGSADSSKGMPAGEGVPHQLLQQLPEGKVAQLGNRLEHLDQAPLHVHPAGLPAVYGVMAPRCKMVACTVLCSLRYDATAQE